MHVLNGDTLANDSKDCKFNGIGIWLNTCVATTPQNALVDYPGITFPEEFSIGMWVRCKNSGVIITKPDIFTLQ